MYKKITHTIVEEHFDHPLDIGIAANVGPVKPTRFKLADIMPKDQFKTFVDNYFIEMEGKLVQFANATFDESQDFQAAIANVMDYESLGVMMGKYYDIEFQERWNQLLGNNILQLLYHWRNTIRKFDNTDATTRLNQNPVFFALLLNQYNNFWDRDIVRTLFSDFFNEFLNLGAAKMAKNKTNEAATLDRIAAAGSKLSNYVANGVIQQNPELFTV